MKWLETTFAAVLTFIATGPVAAQSNVTVRVMAANLTSGSNQRYESPGLNILKAMKPDVVCIQEFNYAATNGLATNTAAALREMVDATFGTNFVYYREPTGAIPNGIISRYPILASGSWDDGDSGITDRGFAWARIDLPGTNDLYAVSIHLKASSGTANVDRRSNQVVTLKSQILANFPANAWLAIGGDCNTYSQTESCMTNLISFVSDMPAPADQLGGTNTNAGRTERYDRVMFSFSMTNRQVPVVVGGGNFINGLVFDSRVTPYLTGISPVLPTDSGAVNMQHMGIVKDFRYTIETTNQVVPRPFLVITGTNRFAWLGVSNVAYRVQSITNLLTTNWITVSTVTSATTNCVFTNSAAGTLFYRVTYP